MSSTLITGTPANAPVGENLSLGRGLSACVRSALVCVTATELVGAAGLTACRDGLASGLDFLCA